MMTIDTDQGPFQKPVESTDLSRERRKQKEHQVAENIDKLNRQIQALHEIKVKYMLEDSLKLIRR